MINKQRKQEVKETFLKDIFEKLQNTRLLESCVMIHDKINDKI